MSSSRASKTSEAFPPVLLLVGGGGVLRDAAIAELRTRVIGDGAGDFNEDRFDLSAPGSDPGDVLAAAGTLPVMAPGRLVLARGCDDRRAKKFREALLPAYLEDPLRSTCLVLIAEKVDRRNKWVKQIGKLGEVRVLEGPTRPADLRRWIEERVQARGKRPGRGMAAALLDLVGTDVSQLTNEIEKAALYVGERDEIGPEDVARVAGQLRARSVFELTDAIGARRLGPALGTLAQLRAQGEAPLAVLGALAGHFRRLARARECQPLEPGEVQRRLGVHPYAARKLAEQARRFEPQTLRRCLAAVQHADSALKGGVSLPPHLVIERFVLSVCA
ncbi:MAG: DNA polymerase III subunit delta [Myxococcales bacterium]|nr:DNA polymerase III subunit delta [Myxococcales bacterium]